jgi:hypothetical protein
MISAQNFYAVLGMCAIVIVCYALRNSEAHYLPDLLGLALALAAPRQTEAIAAWLVVVAIRHTPIGYGLASMLPSWLLVIVLPAAHNMSISSAESTLLESAYDQRISESETLTENLEIVRPVAENEDERIVLAQTEILARLVISGEVGKTKAIQIGAGVKSGKKYQRVSRLVEVEIERQRNHYPPGSNQKRFE